MCGFTVYSGHDKKLKLLVAHEFRKVKYRGPENTHILDLGESGWMGFHRLKIVDVTDRGNQPLIYKNIHLVCNGEIYNYDRLYDNFKDSYHFQSDSDCEVIIPLFLEKGIRQTALDLDAEFVFVIYD